MNLTYIKTQPEVFELLKTSEQVELFCSVCNGVYSKTKKQVLRSFKTKESANMFCSAKCVGSFKTTQNSKEVSCKNCNTVTIKTNAEIKKSKSGFLFCSRSCAAEYNNKLIPKRIKTRTCKYCSKLLHSSTLCIDHYTERETNISKLRVIKKKDLEPAKIRSYNREWNKNLSKKPCAKCGYTRHVELAHIKAVAEFCNETEVGIINNPSNILPLCPTCHWEFDNGYRDEFKDILVSLGKIYSDS